MTNKYIINTNNILQIYAEEIQKRIVLKVFIKVWLNHSQLFEMINMQWCNARINLKIV